MSASVNNDECLSPSFEESNYEGDTLAQSGRKGRTYSEQRRSTIETKKM